MDKKIGLITINYYSESLVKNFIKYLILQTYRNWILIIVDNGKSDNSLEDFIKLIKDNRIIIINSDINLGYSRANNLAYSYVIEKNLINSDDILCFSNSDIILNDRNVLEKLVNNMNNLQCDFIGPKIINNDGGMMLPHLKESNYFKILFHLGNNGLADKFFKYNYKLKKINNIIEVFLLNGSFILCKVSSFEKVGKFDPSIFLYFEEEILFRKAKKLGMKVIYSPVVNVKHYHSAIVNEKIGTLNKKLSVLNSEKYILKNIFKSNKFALVFFNFERFLELLFFKIFHKPKKIVE